MIRWTLLAALVAAAPAAQAAEIRSDYMETRTCDVYTGPCFANGQVGLTGKEALMAWSIKSGAWQGVELAGLKVVLAVQAADTLGFGGGLKFDPYPIKSVLFLDSQANDRQRAALASFVKQQAKDLTLTVTREVAVPIEMSIDHFRHVGRLKAGKIIEIETRRLGVTDCVCTNEMVFYRPLVEGLATYRPAYTVKGEFAGPGLGTHWSNPNTRSAFLGTLVY